jgi:FKBP-type peptidyl-prolyl cis-trans isomerase SlyD
MQIATHKVVSIDYTLTDKEGSVLDSSEGRGPLTYIHGIGQLISGLEASLEGKSAGDALKVEVAPADGYGEWDPEKIAEVPRDQFTGIDDLKVGMQFSAHGEAGEQIVTVSKIEEDTVTVDANHPLAGQALTFDVKIVGVRDATQDELSHGHVHGPGGHH